MKNPRYANSEGGVTIEQDDGTLLYLDAVCPQKALYARIIGGEFGEVAAYLPEQSEAEEKAAEIRLRRDGLLAACDWTQLPDVPTETTQAWESYRQALRDITDQQLFPDAVTWPHRPKV